MSELRLLERGLPRIEMYNPAFRRRVMEKRARAAPLYAAKCDQPVPEWVAAIIWEVAERTELSIEALLNIASTDCKSAQARAEIYYRILVVTKRGIPLTTIGGWFGWDRSTVSKGAHAHARKHNLPPVFKRASPGSSGPKRK